MAKSSLIYRLSLEADKDLEDIYDYTVSQFGEDQAVKYLLGLEEIFFSLCDNPQMGRERKEIRENLRSVSKESHTIFYRIADTHIWIARVLHASRDVIRFMPPQD